MFIIPNKYKIKKSNNFKKYYQNNYFENNNSTYNELNSIHISTYSPNITEIPFNNPLQFFIFICMYSLWFGTFTRKELQNFFSKDERYKN